MPFCPACGEPIKVDTKYCPRCGNGPIGNPEPPMCECPRCHGKRKVPWKVGGITINWVRCPKCKGTGKVPCPR